MIVQKLSEIQHRLGYLPERELRELSGSTATPLHRIHEVASYFPHYRLKPGPKVDVRVCRDMACHLHGALRRSSRAAGPVRRARSAATRSRSTASPAWASATARRPWRSTTPCFWGISSSQARSRIRAALDEQADPPAAGRPLTPGLADRHLRWPAPLRGRPVPGRQTSKAALSLDQRRDQVIEALKVSGLRGMGGAGFPTHIKWASVRSQAGPGQVRRLQRRRERARHLQGPRAAPAGPPTCWSRG